MLMMAPIDKKIQKQISDKIAKSIEKVLKSPELADLSEEQIEQIAKSYYTDSLKEDFSKEIKKAKLKKEKLIEQWLSGFTSKHTVRSFKKNLEYFLNWLNGKSLIDVDALVVDKYLSFLNSNKKLSDNSKRQRIAACSSFFSDLERWEVISRNPFKGAKGLPKKKLAIKDADKIPSNEDLDIIEAHALMQIQDAREKKDRGFLRKEIGNVYALCAFKILRKYGLRVGALNSMRIDSKGNFWAMSKGNEISGKFDSEILSMLKTYGMDIKTPFKKYHESSFSVWLWRVQASPELKGKLSCQISPHSIRHRFAIDYYNRTKDVHQLSKLLGHSSLLVTTAYLAGLKNEII